ncbi:MAG: choice-of-anchor D domain-containing protein [Sedimentisphaerales bacterium]|nr:choice-of-anchor D domain-containing protein [Sedimentisphaerales bacterium]
MHSRENKKEPLNYSRLYRLTLEPLNPRIMLNASTDWVDPDIPSQFLKEGFGIPDAFYSDPATWSRPDTGSLDNIDLNLDLVMSQTSSLLFESTGTNATQAATATSAFTLYLDFDGERVYSQSGDFWLGSSFVDIPAYDLTMFGWAGSEQESINYIAEFVSQDYAPYNISVTTTQPTWGEYTTIYVGGTNDWFRANSGVIGVATYEPGNSDASNYGFAFSEELGVYQSSSSGSLLNFSEYLANLISHEAAHTFGANHVSDTSAIMNPYLPVHPRRLCFGSDGKQDTQSLLGANLGYINGEDDYGDTYLTAQTISNYATIEGILENRSDTDAFTFTAVATGSMTIEIDTSIYGNLDSYLTIRDSDLNIIDQNDDYDGQQDSLLEIDVVEGRQYTIEVSGYGQDSSGTYELILNPPAEPPRISITSGQSIDFGTVTACTTATRSITLTNVGFDDLIISQISTTGDFQPDTVSLPNYDGDDLIIAPGGELEIVVTFEPTQAGSYSDTVIIVCNDPLQSDLTIDLTAAVQPPQADITALAAGETITDNTLTLDSICRGDTGSATITIANIGSDPLLISDVNATLGFSIIDGFSGDDMILDAQESIDIVLQFTPEQRGTLEGTVTIISNDPDQSTLTINLETQVLGGVLTVYDNSQEELDQIDFGTVYAGEESWQNITLVNTGDADLTITDLDIAIGFVLDSDMDINDGIILEAGESLVVSVGYAPEAQEEIAGDLTIVTDNSESPLSTVSLNAMGNTNVLEVTELDDSSDGFIDAGSMKLDANQNINLWRLTNHGNNPLTINLNQLDGTDLQLVGPEFITLAGGQSYTIRAYVNTDLAQEVTQRFVFEANDFNQTTDTITVMADLYAQVGRGQKYRFLDHSGDLVTISMSGTSQARVRLGDTDQPDIQSIELLSGPGSDSLTIKVNGAGTTALGSLAGSFDLNKLTAPDVNLTGSGINLDGAITKLTLGDVTENTQLCFSPDSPAQIQLNRALENSELNINGPLKIFRAREFTGSSLQSDSIDSLILGQCNGDIDITDGTLGKMIVQNGDLEGNVTINGALGSLKIAKGDLAAYLNVQNSIQQINVAKGSITGKIESTYTIGTIKALNLNQADIYALLRIDKINVSSDMLDSTVSVGYNRVIASEADSGIPAASQINALLGTISVMGTYAASNIAVGVAPDSEGNFIYGQPNNASGTIGSINLAHVNTDNQECPFGVVAKDDMEKLRINNQKIDGDYTQEDFYVTILEK